MDGGWDPQADWEAQLKAARAAQAAWEAETGPLVEAPESTPAPATTAVAEPEVPAHTVPLVLFTPFVAPEAPAVPVAGLDAGQAGVLVATAKVSARQGMSGILGQDQLRGDVMPVRFLVPRLTVGQRQRWWLWRAGPAFAAGILIAILANWPIALIVAGLILSAGALFSYRISPAFSPAARASSARRRTRRRLARLGPAGYLALHDRVIPGTDQVIDHLVVGPAGIYAVDSEIWDRRCGWSANDHIRLRKAARTQSHGNIGKHNCPVAAHRPGRDCRVMLVRRCALMEAPVTAEPWDLPHAGHARDRLRHPLCRLLRPVRGRVHRRDSDRPAGHLRHHPGPS